ENGVGGCIGIQLSHRLLRVFRIEHSRLAIAPEGAEHTPRLAKELNVHGIDYHDGLRRETSDQWQILFGAVPEREQNNIERNGAYELFEIDERFVIVGFRLCQRVRRYGFLLKTPRIAFAAAGIFRGEAY